MAVDPKTGLWQPDSSDDTLTHVNRVIDAGGPLMKRAKGIGSMMAAKRGLGNSSLAVGAAENAVLDKAYQIGGQTAAQQAAKNNLAISGQYGMETQKLSDAGAMARLNVEVGSNEALTREKFQNDLKLAEMGDKAAMARLQAQLGSSERISGAEIGSREKLTFADIASREKLSSEQLAAEMARLNASIASNEKLAKQGDEAAMARLQADLSSRAQLQTQQIAANKDIVATEQSGAYARQELQGTQALEQQARADIAALERQKLELQNRTDLSQAQILAETFRLDRQIAANKDLANLDATTRLNISEMDRAANNQNVALSNATALQGQYLQAMSNLLANADIPAEARQKMEASLKAATEAGIGIVEQVTNIDLAWGNNPIVAPGTPSDAITGGGYSTNPQGVQGDGITRIDQPDGSYYLKINGNFVKFGANGQPVGSGIGSSLLLPA